MSMTTQIGDLLYSGTSCLSYFKPNLYHGTTHAEMKVPHTKNTTPTMIPRLNHHMRNLRPSPGNVSLIALKTTVLNSYITSLLPTDMATQAPIQLTVKCTTSDLPRPGLLEHHDSRRSHIHAATSQLSDQGPFLRS